MAGAKVGTYLDFSDVAEDPPVFYLNHYEKRHAVRGYVTSDNNGRAILPARDLFWRNWPKNRKTSLIVLHTSRSLCGLCELSQDDVGKEVRLTLRHACRVHGRFDASSMRKRGWSPNMLTVYVFWKKQRPSQYTSRQRRFEFLLPPGRYRVMIYSEAPDKALESRFEIKTGQKELDVCRLLGLRTKK